MKNHLGELAEFIHGLRWEALPQNVRSAAAVSVLDSVGAALGAAEDGQVRSVAQAYLGVAGNGAHAHLWGTGLQGPLLTAVFNNALMGHTLEMDDVHTGSKTHIGTVVVPAAWGMAQYLGASGKAFLGAVVAGYETMARIGMALGVTSHRLKGWHVTGTAGTFGAAAACAKLLDLDDAQTLSALGLAGSQSCGLWAFLADGASSKALHPARAAASGTEAALLAKAGMTGPKHILDAKDGGMLFAMTDEPDIAAVTRDLSTRYEILYMDRKPYPCCRSTHCAVDAALALRKRYGITGEDVRSAMVDTYRVGYQQCGCSEGSLRPVTSTDAKFSTPYLTACALLFGEVGLRQLSASSLSDSKTMDLTNRIAVRPDDAFNSLYPEHWGCRLTLYLRDERTVEQTVRDAAGSVDNPLSEPQLLEKACGFLRVAYPDSASQLADCIIHLGDAATLPVL